MNDLEICKRIAEIEGKEVLSDDEWFTDGECLILVNQCSETYNPLTDDALCFQLMAKYKVDIEHFKCGTVSAYIEDKNHGEIIDTNPNKAILLAIIEAHKS